MRFAFLLLVVALAAGCAHSKGTAPVAEEPRAEAGSGLSPAPPPSTSAPVAPSGELSTRAFQEFMRTRVRPITDCHARALAKDASAGGRILIRFVIASDGRLTEVATLDSAPEARAVADCVVAAMGTWRTPFRPPEPVTLEYPFTFSH